ncbi:MAG: dockerin type I domain-containing protein [Clostridium sp.]
MKFKFKITTVLLVLVLFIGLTPNIRAFSVSDGAPGKPSLTHDQWGGDIDGNYTISVDMWYGNNGTSYKLYEKLGKGGEFQVVEEGKLEDKSPSAQNFKIQIKGREKKGTYFYYLELINSFGSNKSEEMGVIVGGGEQSKITIEKVDDEKIETQFTINQGVSKFALSVQGNAKPNFKVISNNRTSVKATIENGNVLRVEGISEGRSGLKLIEEGSGEVRYIGCRVRNSKGELPGLPNYVRIGQVSEDTPNDLAFWRDMDTDYTNKRVDIRYIYLNGGPLDQWGSWNQNGGQRAISYINESKKLGIIPYFVYYNIPDSAEDYERDLRHINDTVYMEAYYRDLKLFLDIINEYAEGEPVGIVLEPDFLGYMMQQSKKQPNEIAAAGVEMAYKNGILTKGSDPDFPNTVEGLVKSINYIINKYAPQSTFGWQFNTWSYAGQGVPGTGLMHATETMGFDKGRAFIKDAARITAEYYMAAGVTSYGADFISIDKYGLDGAAQPGAAENPEASNWLWNGDLWNNYIHYTKGLHETTNLPVTLWQLPVGHLNTSEEISPYTGTKFKDLDNTKTKFEDSAPTFFFGDTFTPGVGKRLDYFSKNVGNDPKIKVNGNKVTYEGHIEEARDAGVTTVLFGAGVGDSTDCVGTPPADDYWWITKAQKYYDNPVPLKKLDQKDPEDLDLNGVIDIVDLSLLSRYYNVKEGQTNWNIRYDINKDGIIDIYDLVRVARKI